jgi:hypothetical protein
LDYGWDGSKSGVDYLKAKPPAGVEAIVTNPPFKIAQQFLEKALSEVGYIALLMRMNFLESLERIPLFCECPPSKVWVSSKRLPMMHRYGWAGRRSTSNTCHSWLIWDTRREPAPDGYFDWGAIINGRGPFCCSLHWPSTRNQHMLFRGVPSRKFLKVTG